MMHGSSVTRRRKRPKQRLAFLFGAGAEVSYGMPSGGRFALDIFRHDFDSAQQTFKTQKDSLDSTQYRGWLPDPLPPALYRFRQNEWNKIFEETLDANRQLIAKKIGDLDVNADDLLARSQLSEAQFAAAFNTATGQTFGDALYGSLIKYRAQLGTTSLFDSKYFSAALDLCKGRPSGEKAAQLVSSLVTLLSGTLGQDLARQLNENIFETRPPDFSALDTGDLFSVDLIGAGKAAFAEVYESKPRMLAAETDPRVMIVAFLTSALETIVEESISYQRLMDEYYPFLFKPNQGYAKFVRISIFLHGVREYVLAKQTECEVSFRSGNGYYHDVELARSADILSVSCCGTSNYTDFVKRALPRSPVFFLNGSLPDYLDPFRNRIMQSTAVAGSRRFAVPLLFTQSGVKPMTSVEMSRRFVRYFEELIDADKIVVVGFGFNGDDGHINGLVREALDVKGRRVIVLAYSEGGSDAELQDKYRERLRVERASLLTVLRVDHNRNVDGQPWLDAALAV
jgi:hypothetical protein